MKTLKQLLRLYEGGGIFTAIDTETTGLMSKTDKIIEIGAVKFCKDGVIDKFSTLINPQMPIPYASTKVNGITNQMVCNCPTFFEIHHDFLDFIKDTVLVAHNANFDIGFINAELSRINKGELKKPNVPAVDTLKNSRKIYTEFTKFNLQFLANEFNISVENAHRALDDARVCMELFQHNLAQLKD